MYYNLLRTLGLTNTGVDGSCELLLDGTLRQTTHNLMPALLEQVLNGLKFFI